MPLRYTTSRDEKTYIISTRLGVLAMRFIIISYVTKCKRVGYMKIVYLLPSLADVCRALVIVSIHIGHDAVVSKMTACVEISK